MLIATDMDYDLIEMILSPLGEEISKNERNKFESIRKEFAGSICKQYDEAQTYSDGKWIMFTPTNMDDFEEYLKLLALKRKPDKKVL